MLNASTNFAISCGPHEPKVSTSRALSLLAKRSLSALPKRDSILWNMGFKSIHSTDSSLNFEIADLHLYYSLAQSQISSVIELHSVDLQPPMELIWDCGGVIRHNPDMNVTPVLAKRDAKASLTANSSKKFMCLSDSDFDQTPHVLLPWSIWAPQPVWDASV